MRKNLHLFLSWFQGNLFCFYTVVFFLLVAINSSSASDQACCGGESLCFVHPSAPLKVYPGKRSIVGILNNTVNITVQTCPNIGGIDIYLRSFDIDDPSSNHIEIDPNGRDGNDNRSKPQNGMLNSAQESNTVALKTGPDGRVSTTLTVGLAPGDNYQIMAARSLESLNLQQAILSKPITVWRILHVELDDMAETKNNKIRGIVKRSRYSNLSNQTSIILNKYIRDNSAGFGRFEHGTLIIDEEKYEVTESFGRKIYVKGKTLNIKNKHFTLVDDDTILGNMEGPDVSAMRQVYSPAFIEPRFDGKFDSGEILFDLNSEITEQESQLSAAKGAAFSNPAFWSVSILQGYQMDESQDNDPTSENPNRGRAWPCLQSAFVALEEITDWIKEYNTENQLSLANRCETCEFSRMQDIINHEVGHLLGLSHNDGKSTSETPLGGLMIPSIERRSSHFTPRSLNNLRNLKALPRGECPTL
jgi:hypothetical protein